MEKTSEFNINTHHLFIEFKTAYDSINGVQRDNDGSQLAL